MRKFWQVWLMLLGDGMVVVGLAMMLAPLSVVFQPLNDGAFARFFGAAAAPPEALAYHSFLFGLLGAATVGWGLLVFFVAWKPFARGEAWSWVALAASTGVWFVLDTARIMIDGVTPYLLFNLAVVVAAALPLIATCRPMLAGTKIASTASRPDDFGIRSPSGTQ
jgi:hypothetical protein